MTENNNIVITSAMFLLDIKLHPELYRLCEDGETIEDLLRLTRVEASCSLAPLKTPDPRQRAEQRLNLAFPLDEQEAKDYGAIEDFDAEGEREAHVFTLWLNSPPNDGADIGVTPNRTALSRFKAVEKTNYVVDLVKQNGMDMVGIQGADITAGTKTLVLGLVWQLMRGGRLISDTEMLKRAHTTAKSAKPIRSFKDLSITTGLFFLDLLEAIRPGIVDPTHPVLGAGKHPADVAGLAKLAISIARKMNALIFLVPEDVVDVGPRLILTFVGSLMSISQ
ncbi:calponin homology domain-containing protein [Mycena galericulata]|nr:calponin homology domain-containing protein [Mycena galericulata]